MNFRKPKPLGATALDEWLKRAEAEVVPKIRNSAFSFVLFDGTVDMKIALEVGVSAVIGKPILLVYEKHHPPIDKLKRIADVVVELDEPFGSESSKEKVTAGVLTAMKLVDGWNEKRKSEEGTRQ